MYVPVLPQEGEMRRRHRFIPNLLLVFVDVVIKSKFDRRQSLEMDSSKDRLVLSDASF